MGVKPVFKASRSTYGKGAKPNYGGGGWVWMPATTGKATMKGMPAKGKGKGKGMVKGKGKGLAKPVNKYEQKLRQIDPSLLAWVGGLSPKTTWKQVEKHFAEVAKPTLSDVKQNNGKTTAIVAFKTADDVAAAVAGLNGSELLGKTIEVDVWVKGMKEEGSERKKKPKVRTIKSVKTKFANTQAPKAPSKFEEKLKNIDPSLKVWVGGLSEKTTWKALEKHFSEVAKPAVTDIMKKGKGVVAYKTEEEVASAIATLNGSELDGNTIEVDVWTKPEKRERKKKEADE